MEVEEAGEVYTNYLARANGVQLVSVTSERQNCAGANVLEPNERQIWVSKEGMPQELEFDLSGMKKRGKELHCLGWECWHPYSSNPSVVELWVSEDGEEYIKWARCVSELRAGNHFFRIDPLPRKYQRLRLVIVETHGAANTYLNRAYLLDTVPRDRVVDRNRSYSSLTPQPIEEIPPVSKAVPAEDPKVKLAHLLTELQEDLKAMQYEHNLPPMRFSASTCKTFQPEEPDEGRDSQVKDISLAVVSLAQQVESLRQTVVSRNSGDYLRQLRQELQSELPAAIERPEELWEQEMQIWLDRVLEPRLVALERRVMSRMSVPEGVRSPAPQNLLEELNVKLNQKAQKLAQLERERTRKLRSVTRKSGASTPLDSSAEHVRYRDLA